LARDIDDWLKELGLAKYSALFAENEVDLDIVGELTEQDLKDLDIPLGPRKKLMRAIATLSGVGQRIESNAEADAAVQPIGADGATILPSAHEEAERRQLTVMFCDMVGSTALSAQLDPEDLREVIRAYQDACHKVIASYNGYVARYAGDGILVYFGYPQAHEHDAERAVRTGLGIVQAVANIGLAFRELPQLELAVRIGINTGLSVVGDIIGEGAAEQANVVGETPNIAARLQAVAQPNEVIVGPLTHRLIGDAFIWEDIGEHALKGIPEPVRAWRVIRERDTELGVETDYSFERLPLVGRQEELGLLVRSWEASKNGRGQAVFIQGEAGIGKSRLVRALRTKVLDDNCVWIVTQCSPYRVNSTLFPVIEHLKRVMNWQPGDAPATKLQKLEQALESQPLALEQAVPLFADLMELPLPADRYGTVGMSAQERREQTLDALAGWLIYEAELDTVLHVWEDLHWADATTLELIGICIEQSPTVSMMNILTYRPGFLPPWTLRSHMTQITLNRMERSEIEALILKQTDGKQMPADVVNHIAEKTDGVPLYVEELTKAILEADFVTEQKDRYELTRPLSGVSIPVTLQELLMARLDRLPTIREVAQLGSILGREFAYEMLQAIASLDEEALQNGLDLLVDAELLYQRGRRPHAKYFFKHALVQDAAYQSLLKRTRQFYHRHVAELLEARYPEIVRDQPEILAHHYANAEENGRAIKYLIYVAERAAGKYAHREAVSTLEEARSHAEQLPAEEGDRQSLDLVIRQVHSLHFLGRRQEIVDLLHEYRERLDRTSDKILESEFYFWLGFAHAWLGHREDALPCLHRSLEAATEAGNDAIAGRVHRALATEFVYSGKPLSQAIEHGRRAVTLLERTDDRLWLSQALFTLSYCCIFAGDFDSALEAASQLDSFGDATGFRRAQANATMLAGLAHAMRGEGEIGIDLCQRALDVSPDRFETAFILACLGKACSEDGDLTQSVSALEQAVELADEVRSLQFRAWFRTMLGEAYVLIGAFEKAHDVTCEALEVSAKSEFLVGVGLAQKVLGTISRSKGMHTEAQQHLRAASEAFQMVGARFELGRVELELAETAHLQGADEPAAAHLREAQSIFANLKTPIFVERAHSLARQFGV